MDREYLTKTLAEEYGEKLFYFCLKKTGDSFEAEDLCSEILLCVLEALAKGTVPEDFPAYVWQVARNRYARWAEKKRRVRDTFSGLDVGDYEIEDETSVTENELIRREQIALLRRELAFVSSDYRNVLIAYYLENKPIKEIVRVTGLPKGTVESKLHRGRKRLKEGMNMAREFGIRSYKPEEIAFVAHCAAMGSCGQPWSILRHSLYKNIFLQAYGNPSTAEELALELGIALPYMEDELNYLTEQTFLAKEGNQYETNFLIISKEVQETVAKRNAEKAAEITSILEKLIDAFNAACEKAGIDYYGGFVPYEDAKWVLLTLAFDRFKGFSTPRFSYRSTPEIGIWEVTGYQETNLPFVPFVGEHGCNTTREDLPRVHFSQYKFYHGNIQSRTPKNLTHEEGYAIQQIALGETCDKKVLAKLMGYGYVRQEGDGYVPCAVVFPHKDPKKFPERFTDEERNTVLACTEKLKALFYELTEYAKEVALKELPARFRTQTDLCALACDSASIQRGVIVEQAIRDGWLKDDENTGKTVGAFLYL